MRRTALAMTTALALVPLAGCSSTREQAKKYVQQGNAAFTAHGLRVGARSRDVKVLEQVVVRDANGTAAVVVLRNGGAQALTGVPVAIAVKDAHGKAIWRNDAPGLEAGLTHAALLPAGRTVDWVNDQVQPASGTAVAVAARIGAGTPSPAGARDVRIGVGGAKLEGDPASGVTAVAQAQNRSDIAQTGLVIAAVARRAGRIVAAGRAIVPALKPHGHARFQVFFIGDPRGAQLSFDPQPSTLR